MPERIISNLTTWRDEIELALVFWLIGATIGIGQHLLSPDSFSWRIVIKTSAGNPAIHGGEESGKLIPL